MTAAVAGPAGRGTTVGVAVDRASRILLACQHADGSWPDPASGDVSLAAQVLLAREFLGISTAARTDAAVAHIRACQRADGSWAGGEPGTAADVSASVLSYLALRLGGESPDAYHMATAAGWIRDSGGPDAMDLTGQTWLAMFGLTAWDNLPVPSLDLVWHPAAAQAQSPVVAVTLAIISAFRPVRRVPVELTELRALPGRNRTTAPRPGLAAALGAARSAARPAAVPQCVRWLADWQSYPAPSGCARPVWPASIVALHVAGYRRRHPAQDVGIGWLDSAGDQSGSAWPGLPPVAQTALAVGALRAAGLASDHPALTRAGRWLLGHRTEGPGVGRGAAAPCGWSFCPDGYPRPGDTAVVLAAVAGIEPPGMAGSPVLSSPVRWLARSQHRDGSWGGSAALTGYCVRALAVHGRRDAGLARAVRRGVVWLLRSQLSPGGWPARDRGADLAATCAALPAVLAAGVLAGKPPVTRAVDWLLAQQNRDGGWHAGDVASRRLAGRSDETGTALALTALLAVGGKEVADAAEAAAGWLIRAQLPDGGWRRLPEPGARPGRPLSNTARRSVAAAVPLPLAALGRFRATQDGSPD